MPTRNHQSAYRRIQHRKLIGSRGQERTPPLNGRRSRRSRWRPIARPRRIAAYSAHMEHTRAVLRANHAHVAICKALTDRGLEFDTRITLVNAVCGNTEVAHG